MPAPLFKGAFPVTITESTSVSNEGKYEYTRTRVYSFATLVTPTIGSSLSRDGKTTSLTNISISRKDGLATLVETYTAADTTAPDVYEVSAVATEEPIASHPAFTATTTGFTSSIVSAAGGAITEGSSNVSGGAIFNEDGSFARFSKKATNNFFGVQSFLSPRVSYKRIFSSGAVPTYGQTVAYIYATPRGSPPTVATGRTWLLTALSWENRGNQLTTSGQYQITEEYLSSGPSGWNNVIYYTA